MCFTCIGDLKKMTAEDIIAVRICPNFTYAVAFWYYNNHKEDIEEHGFKYLESCPYMNLLLDVSSEDGISEDELYGSGYGWLRKHIWETIQEFELDDLLEEKSSDEETDDEDE